VTGPLFYTYQTGPLAAFGSGDIEPLSVVDELDQPAVADRPAFRRYSQDLAFAAPSILEHSGLTAGLEMHCREFTGKHGIATSFAARDAPEDTSRPVAFALYRIVQASLQNVARHSVAGAAA
jgi:signal transduction histidine kinase